MFARLRRWLRGRKKNVSLNKPTKQKNDKRDTLRKAKSLHDIVLPSENEDDGFRRNDLDDFDIVLSGELQREHNNNISASTVSLVSPQVDSTSTVDTASPLSQSRNDELKPEQKLAEKTSRENDSISDSADSSIDDSLDGSIVDLVSPSPIETEQTSTHEQNLTLDEMQVMNMFDSVVHDIEIEEKDAESETVSLNDNASNSIPDDNKSVPDDEEIVSAQQKLASHTKSPVDFTQVFGESSGGTTEVAKADNWRMSKVESASHSIKFVESNIYLPPRPELPPTDYPDTDDELRRDDVEDVDDAKVDAAQNSALISPIDSPSAQPDSSSKRANDKLQNQELPNSHPDVETLGTPDTKIHSNTLPKTSHTNGNAQFSVPSTSHVNGKAYSSSVSALPKKSKPRVTSFKSSKKVPQITNAENFTELVDKFEKF